MQENRHIDEDEIDIKEVFRTIYNYKYMIFFLVLLFGLGSAYYAYFKPNVYEASVTIEVGVQERGFGGKDDILSMAMDQGTNNTETEMEIIRSRFLAEKIAEKVNFSHKYYTTRRYKEVELYKSSPFEVGMNRGFGISFELIPLDEKHYRLVVNDAEDENGKPWSFDKKLMYGTEVVTKHFHLNVQKTKATKDAKYRFVVLDPKEIAAVIQGGVKVSQASKYSNILDHFI